jgi:hypothetical protein
MSTFVANLHDPARRSELRIARALARSDPPGMHEASTDTIPALHPMAAPTAAGVPPVRRPQTVPGPAFTGEIGIDEPWGAWLEVPSGGLIAVELHWGGVGAGPTVRLATQAGAWWLPERQPQPPIHRAWMEVPPGWTWISVEAGYAERLPITVATFLPVQVAASA